MKLLRLTDTKRANELTELLHYSYASDEALKIHFAAATITAGQVAAHISDTPTFVLETDDQEMIATASVRLPWSQNPGPFHLPHLGWVATNPKYGHQGYARQIITEVLLNFVKPELAAPGVSLGTAVEHPWLESFYQSLGFVNVDTVRLFPDHQTAYLIKSLNDKRLKAVQDPYLQDVLEKHVLNTITR